MELVFKLFRSDRPVPELLRSNFFHLFMDIAWFGVLSGSTVAFLSIYAVRLGANSNQVGLISAAPAIANLIFSLPSGRLFTPKHLKKNLILTLILGRIFYLFFVSLPFFFLPPEQVWWIIMITFLMNIPGTAMNIGFNSYFPDVVPSEWRGYVAGVRNAFLSITTVITSLICGQVLTTFKFPVGYQIVFALGFFGVVLSTIHISLIRQDRTTMVIPAEIETPRAKTIPVGGKETILTTLKSSAKKAWINNRQIFSGSYKRTMFMIFGFHLAQYLAIPIFPVWQVDHLHLSDQTLSLGNCVFYTLVFLGSMRLDLVTKKFGNRILTGIGIALMGLYPVLIAFSQSMEMFMLTSAVGGIAWSIAGGVYFNYVIEKIPAPNKSPYMAWYSIILNAAILIGSLCGPIISSWIGIRDSLFIFALIRFLCGAAILRWG
jgi:MFS family permease